MSVPRASTSERLAELERRADAHDAAVAVVIETLAAMCREAGVGEPMPLRRYRRGLRVVRTDDAS